MADRPGSGQSAGSAEALAGDYTSVLFEQFVSSVRAENGGLLDLGPTINDNIVFWAERGFRIAAMDLLTRSGSLAEVDLGEQRFAGALCWNAFCVLSRDDARLLIAKLRRALRPGGYVFAIFDGDGRRTPPLLRYRIAGPARLEFRALAGEVEMRAISTSEIDTLLDGFRGTRLTVMRHGSREALAHLPPHTSGRQSST